MTRFGVAQQKHLDEIKASLTDSPKRAYFNDAYFKTILENSHGDWFPRSLRNLLYSDDFSPIYHAVEHALLSQTPRVRYPVGGGSILIAAIMDHCPSGVSDFVVTATNLLDFSKGLKPPLNMIFE